MVGKHGIRVQADYVIDYLGTSVTADICYGSVMNRSNAGVTVVTKA